MSLLRGVLASLSIKLSADSAELDRDLEKAKKNTRDWGNETKAAAMNVGAAMGTAAAALGAAMTAMANKALENMDRQAEFASSISVSVEQLTRLQYAAKSSGVEQEALNNGLKTLVKNSSEAAQGLGKSVGAFNELGISAAKMNELSPDKQFLLLADAMKSVENANDRTRIAIKMFGDEGSAMVNMLMQGQEGLKQLADASDAAGYTVTQSQANMAAAAGDAKDAMSLALDGVSNQLAMQLGPAITKAATWIAEKLPMAIDFVKAAFYGLRLVVSNVFDTITGIVAGMGGSITSLILTPFEKITHGLAYALNILGSDSAASVQSVADNMTAARETADHYAQAFTRIGEAYDANQRAYDEAIDGMAEEQAARQVQLNATKAATLAVSDYVGVNKTKAESDRDAAAAAKELADAEKAKTQAFLSLKNEAQGLWEGARTQSEQYAAQLERINYLEQEGAINGIRAEELRNRLAQQKLEQSLAVQNARGALGGIGGMAAAGEDPMAQAESEWVGKKAALEWMLQQEQITRDEYALLTQQAAMAHQQVITDIEAQAAAKRAQFDALTGQQKTQMVLGQMVQMTAGVANHSKKMFEVNKALALGQAIAALPSAVMQSYSNGGGYPWGLIPAGLMLATGLQQINAIKSAKFGGGTTPSLAGSTPTYNGVPVTGGNSQNTGEDGASSGVQPVTVNVTIGKVDASQGVTAENLTSSIGAVLKDQVVTVMQDHINNDGIIIPPGSRQAAELRGAA